MLQAIAVYNHKRKPMQEKLFHSFVLCACLCTCIASRNTWQHALAWSCICLCLLAPLMRTRLLSQGLHLPMVDPCIVTWNWVLHVQDICESFHKLEKLCNGIQEPPTVTQKLLQTSISSFNVFDQFGMWKFGMWPSIPLLPSDYWMWY